MLGELGERGVKGVSKAVFALICVVFLVLGAVGGYFAAGKAIQTVTTTVTQLTTVTETVEVTETAVTITVSPPKPSGTLVAFVWEDFTVPEVFDPLRKLYPELDVENSIFTSQPEMLAKLKGGFKADVVSPCIDFLPRLVELDLLQPIDPDKLSNWEQLLPALREYPEIWFDGKLYMVPTAFGVQAGVTYRKDKVNTIETWMDIFNPEYEGRVLITNDARIGIVIGAWALGYEDPWNLSSEDLQKIKDFYMEHRDVILKFYESDVEARELLAAGDAWIIAGSGAAHAYWLRSAGIDAEFVLPEGKGIGWLCGLSIAKTAENLEGAHAYIDYFISEDPQYFYAYEWLYGPSNQKAFERLPPEKIEESGMIGPEVLKQVLPLIEPPNMDEWIEVWEEILAS